MGRGVIFCSNGPDAFGTRGADVDSRVVPIGHVDRAVAPIALEPIPRFRRASYRIRLSRYSLEQVQCRRARKQAARVVQ